ncbi:Uncharacterised protein [Bartonella doshiae]|uniref:UVR domain-containing protein n=1 Tax=Bartonella doshiae TaxID=33044 RepID=A0A380ZP47_BARDO|nr:Uncharacterised protein [Bartonella doshiae]
MIQAMHKAAENLDFEQAAITVIAYRLSLRYKAIKD